MIPKGDMTMREGAEERGTEERLTDISFFRLCSVYQTFQALGLTVTRFDVKQ
jgi:hypothetical protein